MFCYQCEQTAKGQGCTQRGVCGKDPETAALQDLLVHAAEGIAQYNHRAHQLGARSPELDRFLLEALSGKFTILAINADAPEVAEAVLADGFTTMDPLAPTLAPSNVTMGCCVVHQLISTSSPALMAVGWTSVWSG